jgi:hypothetical protein
MGGSNSLLRRNLLASRLPDRLQKCRQRQTQATRNLCYGFDRRIPKTRFNSSDVGPIEFGSLRQILLSPLALLSALSNPCANVAQERIFPFGHASGCRCALAMSIDYQ